MAMYFLKKKAIEAVLGCTGLSEKIRGLWEQLYAHGQTQVNGRFSAVWKKQGKRIEKKIQDELAKLAGVLLEEQAKAKQLAELAAAWEAERELAPSWVEDSDIGREVAKAAEFESEFAMRDALSPKYTGTADGNWERDIESLELEEAVEARLVAWLADARRVGLR